MTWSYSGDPSNSDLDAVRFRTGDTDTNDQQLSDEEISYLLTQEGSVLGAAIATVRGLIAKYSRKFDQSVGSVKYSYSQVVKQYTDLLGKLEAEENAAGVSPFVGGISKSDKKTRERDADRVDPSFTKKKHDVPSYDPKSGTYFEEP